MNIASLVSRFEFYTRDNKLLLHVVNDPANKAFAVCDMEDIAVSVRNGLKLPCLLLQVPVTEKEGEIDSVIEHWEASFIVLAEAANGDYAGRMQAYSDCKDIADQVIFQMIEDAGDFYDGALPKTSEGKVGPVVDNIYGWGVSFGFEMGIGTIPDPAQWGGAE